MYNVLYDLKTVTVTKDDAKRDIDLFFADLEFGSALIKAGIMAEAFDAEMIVHK